MKSAYGKFQVCLNKKGIANLIPIPIMEASGYITSTHTHTDWVVTIPEGKDITFKRDKRVSTGMPYIKLREQKEGIVIIKTVRKNMGGHTPEQTKGVQLDRVVQGSIGHPLKGVLKQMIIDNIPKNMPIGTDNVADALAIYGPPGSRLKGKNTREKPNHGLGRGKT